MSDGKPFFPKNSCKDSPYFTLFLINRNHSFILKSIMSVTYMELIEQSRSGDSAAFGQIVRRYQGIVSGVVYGILGDFHKSEDIAQETFLIAWKKLDELREVEKLPGWLCAIAKNLARQTRLQQAKIPTVPVSLASEIETADDPARLLAQSEQNRLIWNALEKIPEKYRLPLVLFYRSEQSVPEIALALELSENTLHVRLNRARKFLRKELEKQVEGAIRSSGPGEFFSLAVLAALPAVASVTSAGKAVAQPRPFLRRRWRQPPRNLDRPAPRFLERLFGEVLSTRFSRPSGSFARRFSGSSGRFPASGSRCATPRRFGQGGF